MVKPPAGVWASTGQAAPASTATETMVRMARLVRECAAERQCDIESIPARLAMYDRRARTREKQGWTVDTSSIAAARDRADLAQGDSSRLVLVPVRVTRAAVFRGQA